MKKGLFGLGVVAVLSFPVVGMAYSDIGDDYSPYKFVYPSENWQVLYALDNADFYFIENGVEIPLELKDKSKPNYFDIADLGKQDFSNDREYYSGFNHSYPLSVEKMNKARGFLDSEWDLNNIDFVKHFHNIDSLDLVGNFQDARPIENAKNLTTLDMRCSTSSFSFLEKLNNLKNLSIYAENFKEDGSQDETIKAITDVSFLDNLDTLEYIDFVSYERPFSTISLKKSMKKYVLINPFTLSKQFKNPDVKITSKTPGFTFEDDILTWDGINPETKELQISWEFRAQKNESGTYAFNFDGDSVIPINWID